ncbi:MAG TPA: hypothetical protein VLI04_14285 [Nocardioidaceae bacterium]|nr:hypothetical protein [Nocardioidaceae bacterium]
MADLFDTLHALVDDLDAPPLAAAEVRRRGDRIRRRRIALQALATATVVAIVVWGLVVLLGDTTAPHASPPETRVNAALIGGSGHGRV